jgi:putative FmdB family regulatory protein
MRMVRQFEIDGNLSPVHEFCILEGRAGMPLYEYRCEQCGKSFEMLRRMQDADRELQCPDCKSQEVERLLSTFTAGGCTASSSSRFT